MKHANRPPHTPDRATSPFPRNVTITLTPYRPQKIHFSFTYTSGRLSPKSQRARREGGRIQPSIAPQLRKHHDGQDLHTHQDHTHKLLRRLHRFQRVRQGKRNHRTNRPHRRLQRRLRQLTPRRRQHRQEHCPQRMLTKLQRPPHLRHTSRRQRTRRTKQRRSQRRSQDTQPLHKEQHRKGHHTTSTSRK